MKDSPKIGYALGAGGVRGFCHIGALEVLEEHGIRPDYIAGTSMGSVIGGLYALGHPLADIKAMAMTMKKRDVLDISPFLFSHGGLANDKRFVHRLEAFSEDCRIEDCVIPYRAVSCDLVQGKEYVFDSGVIWQAMRASSSIPGVFEPVEIDGRILIDGALLTRVPVDVVQAMGADVVLGIDALGDFAPEFKLGTPLSVILRAFDVVDKYIFDRKRHIADVLVTPDMGDLNALDFSPAGKARAVAAGRSAMLAHIGEVEQVLAHGVKAH